MFFALSASIEGWRHCRPIIVVDGTFLTTQCGGTLYTACAKDGNNQVFPLAFGIGDSENDDSYCWFFDKIKHTFHHREQLVIVSDRHKSIENAIRIIFPEAEHGICSYHLKQNLKMRFRSAGLMEAYKVAVYTYSRDEFEQSMAEINAIDHRMFKYLREADPRKWARCYYPRGRYNIQTSNLVESMNNRVKHLKRLPIIQLLEELRSILQQWFSERSLIAASTMTSLCNWANHELKKKQDWALRMQVIFKKHNK